MTSESEFSFEISRGSLETSAEYINMSYLYSYMTPYKSNEKCLLCLI